MNQVNSDICPPYRFTRISIKITRGSYPIKKNFRFLQRLQLKTIISLTPEFPNQDIIDYATLHSIQLLHVPIQQNTTLSPHFQQQLAYVAGVCELIISQNFNFIYLIL